jgi:hypothetical protein
MDFIRRVHRFVLGQPGRWAAGAAGLKNMNLPEVKMKKLLLLLMLLAVSHWGCAFLGGAAVGSLATGAGYEINAKQQMDKLEEDYKNERISRREYEQRKKQIEAGSIIY